MLSEAPLLCPNPSSWFYYDIKSGLVAPVSLYEISEIDWQLVVSFEFMKELSSVMKLFGFSFLIFS